MGYDSITDFQGPGAAVGDVIDLSAIDANPGTGADDPFVFNGTGALTSGTIRLLNSSWANNTMVQGLTTTGQYFHIWLLDGTTAAASYTAADFVL